MLAVSVKRMTEVFENKGKMFYAYEIAEEKRTLKTDQSNQGSSIGVTFSAGTMVSVNGQFYSGQDKENGSATSYKGSTVTAADTLTMKSGQDTDIVGSTVAGNKVNIDVGGNLNIQSLQTKKEYNEDKDKGINNEQKRRNP